MRKPVFKLFCLLLFALVLGGCGQRQGAEKQGGGSQGELSYEVGDAEVTITDCDETTEGDLEIPAEIEGLPVTRIGEGAFFLCAGLTSITIPESVNSIGEGAFDGCSSITSITIPEGVTSILDFAFNDCSSLTSITIPNSVSIIGRRALHRCYSLTSIIIPDSVTSIEEYAFHGCSSLTEITIPKAFHSEDEASRLGLDKLWPDGFALPDSSSK